MMRSRVKKILLQCLLLLLFQLLSCNVSASSSGSCIVLRVRLPDGRMERLQVDAESPTPLKDALKPLKVKKGISILQGNKPIKDETLTVQELGLKNGSLLTLQAPKKKQVSSTITQTIKAKDDRWDPFPELAKDYASAVRKAQRRRSTARMSYGDLANLQSELHMVEPQKDGPLKRVYMCRTSAENFQSNCIHTKTNSIHNRVGLLLGTIQRERVNSKRRPRTSLSSTTEDQEYCSAGKVHAIWEPPQKGKSKHYDPAALENVQNNKNVLRVAKWLGLQPVGWIFTYNDDRHKDEDALPVLSQDIESGAMLQIDNMKASGRIDGSRFVTLAMDARNGGTEAFQLSDVAVQMVAENMFETHKDRHVTTRHAVLVDGKETKELDSVLCLVNTAMLSHEGSFSSMGTTKKSNGSLTNKTRKSLLKALDSQKDDDVLRILCDFNVLLALDEALGPQDSEKLCGSVRKWSRGLKHTTELDNAIKRRLKTILDH